MSTEWSRTTRYIVGVSLALSGIFILYLSRSVISLLVIAALIAVIVRPSILWLHHRARLPRGLAVALVYLIALILVPLALALAIPAIIDAVNFVLNLDYQSILQNIVEWLRATLNAIKAWPLPAGSLNLFVDQTADALLAMLASGPVAEPITLPSVETILRSIGTALTATFRTAAGVVGSLFSRFALLLFIFLASVYISLSAHTYHDAFLRSVPERFRPEINTLMNRIGLMWNAFFRGQLTLMLVIGVISWLVLTILGVPGAVYLGIVAGLLEIIPNIGPIIATIPAVIVALLQGSLYLPLSPLAFALVVILFYILVQQLENNLIVPRVLGGAVDLPALVVMTGVLVGAEVGGLLGALLATPVIASLREIARYAYRKILGEDPFPPEEGPGPGVPAFSSSWLKTLLDKVPRFRKPKYKENPPEQLHAPGSQPGAKVYPPVDQAEEPPPDSVP